MSIRERILNIILILVVIMTIIFYVKQIKFLSMPYNFRVDDGKGGTRQGTIGEFTVIYPIANIPLYVATTFITLSIAALVRPFLISAFG